MDVLTDSQLPGDDNLLVFVDQFEEILDQRESADRFEGSLFVDLLATTAREALASGMSVYVVITLRSDSLSDCSQFTNLSELINQGQFFMPT